MKESQWGSGVDFWFLVSEVALSIVEAMVISNLPQGGPELSWPQ